MSDTLPGIDVPTVTYPPVAAIPYKDPDGRYLERAVTGALVASIRSGEYPHVAADGLWRHGRGFIDLDDLRPHLPVGSVVERTYESRWDRRFFVRGTDFVIGFEAYPDLIRTEVAATSLERAREVLDQLRDRLEIPPPPRTTVQGCSWTCEGDSNRLDIDRVDWRAIADNYPTATRNQLSALMAATAWSRPSGRLLLFHGPPGTGKTFAVRALITQWEAWCRPELIVDPDVVFRDASYLTRVIGFERNNAKSRLLLCEDLDDLLTPRRTGGLERLLNLADGVLGQGRSVVILITTNTRPAELDAALLRPGRCMANIDFQHFSIEEARTRLRGTNRKVSSPMTLAELYEAEGTVIQVRSDPASLLIGAYL